MAASLSIDGGTGAIGYYDTLAQSFFVESQMHATVWPSVDSTNLYNINTEIEE